MKIFGSHFRYVQGAGIIEHISDIVAPLGENIPLKIYTISVKVHVETSAFSDNRRLSNKS